MFVGITNTPRDYAWGSRSAIAGLLGTSPSGSREAELWLGTHPGSPSRLKGAEGTLAELTTLPFLLKVLAAEEPLSLQAHPNAEQAREGFERENAAGIPLGDPLRNYGDPRAKPELIFALSDPFEALCGFRPVAATRSLLARLGPDPLVTGLLERLVDDAALPAVFEWLLSRGEGVPELIERIAALSAALDAPEFATVVALAKDYPGDPGVIVSLLLNRVSLHPGQVLYLPAGNVHAYLTGLGIELMTASDNVLRGGLTAKRVDVPELVRVVDFTPLPAPLLDAVPVEPGVLAYRPPVPDFELVRIEVNETNAVYAPAGECIVLCVDGAVGIRGAHGEAELRKGEALYVSADESLLDFAGTGVAFLASRQSVETEGHRPAALSREIALL